MQYPGQAWAGIPPGVLTGIPKACADTTVTCLVGDSLGCYPVFVPTGDHRPLDDGAFPTPNFELLWGEGTSEYHGGVLFMEVDGSH